MKQPVGTLETK